MFRPGFGKFVLICLVMLAFTGLIYRLLSYAHNAVFGGPLPGWFLGMVIGLSVFGCAINFLYRAAYEGHLPETGNAPSMYPQIKEKLGGIAFLGVFIALVFIWAVASQIWGWIWVGVYIAAEIWISSKAEKRLMAYRFEQAKAWFPEMTPAEQLKRAEAWVRSGLEPFEFELRYPS
jgi:hypothetical protein